MASAASQPDEHVKLALLRNFEFKVPLAWLLATPSSAIFARAQGGAVAVAATEQSCGFGLVCGRTACRWIRCRWKDGLSCRW